MSEAFDGALLDLGLVKRDDPVVEMVAKLVIELVRQGEREPGRLRKRVVQQYGPRP